MLHHSGQNVVDRQEITITVTITNFITMTITIAIAITITNTITDTIKFLVPFLCFILSGILYMLNRRSRDYSISSPKSFPVFCCCGLSDRLCSQKIKSLSKDKVR